MLSNKLALITGGASGIGRAVARLYAKNGANLCLVDMTSDNLNKLAEEIQNENKSVKISTHLCDVSNSGDVANLFKSIRESHELKTPNVVVNSAGITRDQVLVKLSEKDFDKVINVNLKGTFLVNQQAVRSLLESLQNDKNLGNVASFASLINIASVVGKYGNIGQANYAASKAGVEGLTKTIAKEVGKYRIRCNAILPGFIETPMTDKVPQKVLDSIVKSIPLRRIGQPEDIAQLALFLASDSSSYINGASIECSGGLAF
ncbi:unnamed protein product [Brachionus calyciflorus]|uniref:(3R)-3-hydroxyacyl-CoA dehydrogenase n=1 Tax=Brachionus calyciflorus TaxID=104777 RepID=A0A814C0P6_9BILA|nr:unnamed protein product [Brachionus calyciflorus]